MRVNSDFLIHRYDRRYPCGGVGRLGGGVGTGALRRGAGTGTMGACGGWS